MLLFKRTGDAVAIELGRSDVKNVMPVIRHDIRCCLIIVMAHTLRFKVLAEGVETSEQLAFLQDQGCDSYQGLLKSPALAPDAFAKLLSESGLE